MIAVVLRYLAARIYLVRLVLTLLSVACLSQAALFANAEGLNHAAATDPPQFIIYKPSICQVS